MTRAIYENKAFLITDAAGDPHLSKPDEPVDRDAFDVARSIMTRSGAELSATQMLAKSFEDTWGLQRTGAIWVDITAQLARKENHDLLSAAAGDHIAALVEDDEAAPAFWMTVGEALGIGVDEPCARCGPGHRPERRPMSTSRPRL